MAKVKEKADYFFEVSWEVCNKVGGIHTVVTSKIIPMLSHYHEGYFAVGPYIKENIENNKKSPFKKKPVPEFLKNVFDKLKGEGINCHFGSWLIAGEPNTILIEFSEFTKITNGIKKDNWDHYMIDSLNSVYHDYDEPMVWSTAVGKLVEAFKNEVKDKRVVVQSHEWMAGGAILYLKKNNVKVGTVFTTHATMLGRTLATHDYDIYGKLNEINPEEKAYEFNIQAKYLTEKALAHNSDVFSTVSEITGIEASHFLGKKPDILLPNGLDIQRFPSFDQASVKHKILKNKVKKFLSFYFFPYYSFDLDNTLIFFLAGRYEFHDKGVDVLIEALGKLNAELKKKKSNKTVVAFIWVPAGIKEIRPEIIKNREYYEDIEESLHDVIEVIKERVLYGFIGKKKIDKELILGKDLLKEAEKKLSKFHKSGKPPLSTHELVDENNDSVMNSLKKNKLDNSKDSPVKVIFYPTYLNGSDGLVDLNYYEAIMASHLGIFPSYYEPWGYTPLEAGALGVASITTDLAGFGRYIKSKVKGKKHPGIFVLERENKKDTKVVKDLHKVFSDFVKLTKQERIENKQKARKIAEIADWKVLADNYIKAHNMALDKVE